MHVPAPLHPALQLDKIGQAQQCLGALPASLQALACLAAKQAAALQRQHGFTLHGLEQLLQGQAGGTAPAGAGQPAGGALTGSLLLSTAVPPCSSAAEQQGRQQQRQEYASSVLAHFKDKLMGRMAAPIIHTEDAGRGGGSGDSVAVQVQQLIAAAVSEANLARMYEGWMPWV